MDNFVQIEPSWQLALQKEWTKPYFEKLIRFIRSEYQTKSILPKQTQLFTAFNQCPFKEVKVIVLGQDPYPTPSHANGLCFSVESNIKPFPKSLNNIFQEIHDDLGILKPENGDLSRWARQGVFLLNTVLTLQAHKSNSHKGKGWEIFTDEVIKTLSAQKENLIFILWGSKAQRKKALISSTKHLVLEAPHPSPLSAYRGFFGCRHFSKTNDFLIKTNQQPINW